MIQINLCRAAMSDGLVEFHPLKSRVLLLWIFFYSDVFHVRLLVWNAIHYCKIDSLQSASDRRIGCST